MGLDISQCLNPDCLHQNPPQAKFCQRCGSKLLLADRYRATRLLGRGGMGRAYEARDQHRLDTPCVIKQFLPLQQGKAAIEKATQLFQQEAMRLRDLGKHPQIPDLLAFVEQQGKLYLVQELIEGKTLLQEMYENGRFSEEQVKAVLNELLPVLEFVHQRQVIHRDIKLDNIMRSPSGSLVLIDFGVSKQTTTSFLSQVGTVTGTPGYAPIEQSRGIVYPASDLYSLGVTCIRLLTGCLPTDKNGSLADELFDYQKLRWLWRSQLQKQGQTISPTLDGVLDKLLQDLPDARYQTAAEVMVALELEQREPQGQEAEALRDECKRLRNQLKESERARTNLEGRLETQKRQRQDLRSRLDQQKSELETQKRQCQDLEYRLARAEAQTGSQGWLGRLFNAEPAQEQPASSLPRNYTRLRDLLAAGEWQEADWETANRMLEAMGKHRWLDVRKKDIDNFPCEDLEKIDRLWVDYSKGRFGLSLQKRIYDSAGGTCEYDEKIWKAFGVSVGWKKGGFWRAGWLQYSELTFDLTAPPAHLPVMCFVPGFEAERSEGGFFKDRRVLHDGGFEWYWIFLAQRLAACRVV